jgi:hypothetical protein
MPEVTPTQLLLARVALLSLIAFAILGAVWYGLSAEVNQRIWRDIAERPGGSMSFRFVLQPVMAAIAAFHDGFKDARQGRGAYLWSILTSPAESGGRLREGLVATARIILLGLGMDAIYQATVLKTFYPGEMVLVAVLLAFLPYLFLRGPISRFATWWLARKPQSPTH